MAASYDPTLTAERMREVQGRDMGYAMPYWTRTFTAFVLEYVFFTARSSEFQWVEIAVPPKIALDKVLDELQRHPRNFTVHVEIARGYDGEGDRTLTVEWGEDEDDAAGN